MALAVGPAAPLSLVPLLRVSGVGVRYGTVRALDQVDLEIREGDVVGLAGENGAGKSTLVRCIAGDMAPSEGRIWVGGEALAADPRSAVRHGVAVVWQDLALCDNLDVAANLLLGRERRLMLSEARFHARAAATLAELAIPISDTAQEVGSLSGGERQLVAIARALSGRPALLVLDEPTSSLGLVEATQVEALISRLRRQGTTILLVSHDIDQLFRLADRIVVLRRGRAVADVDTARSHPDDVMALLSGQEIDASARSQLSRLGGLSDQLASADPSSSLSLILSALAAALDADQLCIHLLEGERMRAVAVIGLPSGLLRAWADLPVGSAGGPVGEAAAGRIVVDADIGGSDAWSPSTVAALAARLRSSWSVPISGSAGIVGVVTVFRRNVGRPRRDELELVNLYAGYAARAVERDRLLTELTARNRVLETIREVLETLAGPVSTAEGLVIALQALRRGLEADEVSLLTLRPGGEVECRAHVEVAGMGATDRSAPESAIVDRPEGEPTSTSLTRRDCGWQLAVNFHAPGGPSALLARWRTGNAPNDRVALIEDAAHSVRLALEREESERSHRQATSLGRSQELQRQFLSRLSHELRTPLTAIRGYASSLMQSDVTWDDDSQGRFLSRIGAESARLGRLVDDLLDFSAIESSILRIHPDWCDLPLVLDAARSCLAPPDLARVTLRCADNLPPLWGDHDRLEQVFVNLFDNALRHNPAGTKVEVTTFALPTAVTVVVTDDGLGIPAELTLGVGPASPLRRSPTAGAGLGLSIAKGIIDAHGGTISAERLDPGSRFVMNLPIEQNEEPESASYRSSVDHD